jgi:hypothetical protein
MTTITLELTRLFADAAGRARFGTTSLPMSMVEFAPPAPAVEVSKPATATSFVFLRLPKGWTSDAHPAPSKQLMVILKGTLDVTVSAGEVRRFGVGDAVLTEDTSGEGHSTTCVDGEVVIAVTQYGE